MVHEPVVLPHPTAAAAALEERLEAGLRSLRIEVSMSQRTQLSRFLVLLAKWNSVYNLTSVRDAGDMLVIHLLDSLSVLTLVDRYRPFSVVDVGSGAGLPAIPLAIVRPALEVYSVDAVAKKIAFQLQARSALMLRNLYPSHARIESFNPPSQPAMILSRAFADLCKMLASIDHLADATTTVIAMKGRVPAHELASLPSSWAVEEVEMLEVPFLGAQRCAVVLKRAAR